MSIEILNPDLRVRKLKKLLPDIILSDDNDLKTQLIEVHNKRLLSPLLSISYTENQLLRWKTIEFFSLISENLPKKNLEDLRTFIRKLIWMLTEESGGIAWTAPAIMGSLLSSNKELADTYSNILFSYIYEDEEEPENFLDHPPHRESAFWGIYKLLTKFPDKINGNEYMIISRCSRETEDNNIALLCLISKIANFTDADDFLRQHAQNNDQVQLFIDRKFEVIRISDIVNTN